jgi:hypothetical protein
MRQAVRTENRQPFEVQSYIGTDIAQMRDDGERPPRSAKLVVDLEIGPNPADILAQHQPRALSMDLVA